MNYENILFLKNFIDKPNTVGSIKPSSKYLTNSILSNIDFSNSSCIIEYGTGTGVFTKEIIKRKNKATILLSFECDDTLYNGFGKQLNNTEENVYIINDTAERVLDYLNKYNIKNVDYIISGLPFSIIPKETSTLILENTLGALKLGGEFRAFQYSLHYYSNLKKLFSKVTLGFQSLNIPPAFIYYCKK
ncbi:MAG: ribosomal RNA adenine dimethylase [Flavobacteriales bacterium]|nr:ribosomal RNA adenine dimethylase [Flavobacteriales bacterium]